MSPLSVLMLPFFWYAAMSECPASMSTTPTAKASVEIVVWLAVAPAESNDHLPSLLSYPKETPSPSTTKPPSPFADPELTNMNLSSTNKLAV